MKTYRSLFRDVTQSVLDRMLGRDVARWTEQVSYDKARRLLENTEEVRVTRFSAGIVPATTHRLEGEEAGEAWRQLRDTYTLGEPLLEATYRDGECAYELRTRYNREGWYGGEYRFEVDVEGC